MVVLSNGLANSLVRPVSIITIRVSIVALLAGCAAPLETTAPSGLATSNAESLEEQPAPQQPPLKTAPRGLQQAPFNHPLKNTVKAPAKNQSQAPVIAPRKKSLTAPKPVAEVEQPPKRGSIGKSSSKYSVPRASVAPKVSPQSTKSTKPPVSKNTQALLSKKITYAKTKHSETPPPEKRAEIKSQLSAKPSPKPAAQAKSILIDTPSSSHVNGIAVKSQEKTKTRPQMQLLPATKPVAQANVNAAPVKKATDNQDNVTDTILQEPPLKGVLVEELPVKELPEKNIPLESAAKAEEKTTKANDSIDLKPTIAVAKSTVSQAASADFEQLNVSPVDDEAIGSITNHSLTKKENTDEKHLLLRSDNNKKNDNINVVPLRFEIEERVSDTIVERKDDDINKKEEAVQIKEIESFPTVDVEQKSTLTNETIIKTELNKIERPDLLANNSDSKSNGDNIAKTSIFENLILDKEKSINNENTLDEEKADTLMLDRVNDQAVNGEVLLSTSDSQQKNLSINIELLNETTAESNIEKEASKSISYVTFFEGEQAQTLVAEKISVDSQKQSIFDFLALDWRIKVPTQRQRSDRRYDYCQVIYTAMRNDQFNVVAPYAVDAGQYNRWQQVLGDLRLTQVADQPLHLFLLSKGEVSVNVVSTLFKVDQRLKQAIPGNRKPGLFYGLLAFADSSINSIGGAGRFYETINVDQVEQYIVQWQNGYYQLQLTRIDNFPRYLEVVPLLFERQQQQRNCRWQNR